MCVDRRPRLADQEDSRVPLCVYCLMAFWSSAVAATLILYTGEPLERFRAGNMKIRQDFPIHNFLAGRPAEFVAMLRELGPDRPFLLRINGEVCGGFAEVEYFGTKVCVTHLYTAHETYRSGRGGLR